MEQKLKDVKVGDRLIKVIRFPLSEDRDEVIVETIIGAVVWVTIPPESIDAYRAKVQGLCKDLGQEFDEQRFNNGLRWHYSVFTGGEIDVHHGYDGIYAGSILIKPE